MFTIIGADQRPYGPVSADTLRQWIAEGRANGQTLARTEGGTEWRPLASFPEFASLFPAAAAAAPPPAPGPQPARPGARPHIPTYLPQAIVVTLCCCLPLGIPAIVHAAQVNSKLDAGDLAGAQAASDKAKKWFWIALVTGAVWLVIQLGFWLTFSDLRPHSKW